MPRLIQGVSMSGEPMCEACGDFFPRVRWREEYQASLCDTCYAQWCHEEEETAGADAAPEEAARPAAGFPGPVEVLNG